MKIAVTGALGHIGSELIRQLPSTFVDSEILLIDDLRTQRYCSLFNLPETGRYTFIEADVLTADLRPILQGTEVVVHLAAITDAAGSFQIKEQVEQVNFLGTKKVAEACIETNSAIIFPSTTSVYGMQSEVVDESCPASLLKPQSPYADSKLQAERLLQDLGASHDLRFVIGRFGTIFGTSVGMRFHTAINKFCWQAVMHQPLTVWRTALNQNRPYLDLNDAVRTIMFMINRSLYDRSIYNVVTKNTSVQRIVEIISTHIPDVTVRYVDTEIMNQLSYHVANDRFVNLGFEFKGDLERGIADTLRLLKTANCC
jgi:UDP-glucose 4-epimerase